MHPQKTVLITGSNKGLGLELVKVFAKNGWKVIATTRNKKHLVDALKASGYIEVLELDVASQASINNLAKILSGTPLDVLINNAGIYDDDIDTVEKATQVFQTNIIGPRILTESLLQNLEKGTEKLLVSMSSPMSTFRLLDSYKAQHWPYSASKAALNLSMIGINKLHPQIKSVLINPGWMQTQMGGEGATIKPETSAKNIYNLINNHQNKLPNGKLVDTQGKLMDF